MPKLPKRFRLWIVDYLPDSLTALSAVSFTFAGIGPSYQWSGRLVWGLLIAGVACAIASIVANRRGHRPTFLKLDGNNRTLEAEVARCEQQINNRVANLVDVVNVLLRDLANGLGIYKGDTRLSVYRHSDDKSYLVGRVSPNEDYAAVGRTSYPDTQGFIGKVWRSADDKTNVSFPASRQDWIDTQVESYGFSQSEAESLKMHAVVMTATKLRRDPHGDAFGVL
jgi:hypothetical protein